MADEEVSNRERWADPHPEIAAAHAEPEIEVTHAMIEAGLEALKQPADVSAHDYKVGAIFRAMMAARKKEGEQS